MENPLAPRQRVYLSSRAIFSGHNAQVRKRREILDIIHNYRGTLGPLLTEMGEEDLARIIRKLLDAQVYSSPLRAKAMFPELFESSPRDTEREACETQAARTAHDVLEEIQSGNDDNATLAGDIMVDRGTSPGGPVQPPLPTGTKLTMPSLYPSYVPYRSQHLIIKTAQDILEDCCFDFAEKWMPDIVEHYGWDCAAAVELPTWTSIFIRYSDKFPPHAVDLDGGVTLKQLFYNTHRLRHAAVHRVPTTARGISMLLQHAIELAQALQDHQRASQIEALKMDVDEKVRAMELTKNFLESSTSAGLESIRRQREELDRKERELVANMVRIDRDNKVLIGRLLMESVQRALAPTTGLSYVHAGHHNGGNRVPGSWDAWESENEDDDDHAEPDRVRTKDKGAQAAVCES